MTIVLAIIGGTVVIIGAASKVPPAAAAFLRACIPLISAYRELCNALRPDHDITRTQRNDAPVLREGSRRNAALFAAGGSPVGKDVPDVPQPPAKLLPA
jgi:hypothetical protein